MSDDLDILKKLSAEITAEMDWEILSNLLVFMDGWVRIKLDYNNKTQLAQQEITDWVIENVPGSFKSHHNEWLFRDEKDAAFFALRWR